MLATELPRGLVLAPEPELGLGLEKPVIGLPPVAAAAAGVAA